jgi:hypothetical protein
MRRSRRTLASLAGVAALVALAPACAGTGTGTSGPAVAAPIATAPPKPATVTVDAALGRTADEGYVLLRLSVARPHPLAGLLVPFILAWPGWEATLTSLTSAPLGDLDWIAVVGPKDPTRQRMLLRTTTPDDAMDARLEARGDGSLRVVGRVQPHLVAALPPEGAEPIVQALRVAHLTEPDDPEDPDEVLHVDFPHPHGAMLFVPENVRRAVVRGDSRPGGAAEGFVELTFDDDATAKRMAGELQARADAMNNVMVRLLTRDLLGGLVITAEGPVVKLVLPATREQLESLATLASALLPAPARH